MLEWLNRFGHGISYDEVALVETFLATEEVKNQALKSFCPLLDSTLNICDIRLG